jgi:hypothetical protein
MHRFFSVGNAVDVCLDRGRLSAAFRGRLSAAFGGRAWSRCRGIAGLHLLDHIGVSPVVRVMSVLIIGEALLLAALAAGAEVRGALVAARGRRLILIAVARALLTALVAPRPCLAHFSGGTGSTAFVISALVAHILSTVAL